MDASRLPCASPVLWKRWNLAGIDLFIYPGWSTIVYKEIRYRVLARALRKQGCTSRPRKGDHEVWYCPCGQHMAVAVKARIVSPGVVQDIVTKLACLPGGWL